MTAATFRRTLDDSRLEFVLDDGHTITATEDLLARSPFRALRVGQRVRLTLGDGAVTAIDLPG